MPPSFRHAFGLNLIETFMRITLFSIIANFTHIVFSYSVKSKFVCKLLLGTCGAKGCLASLS
jgi:hypothetical protein